MKQKKRRHELKRRRVSRSEKRALAIICAFLAVVIVCLTIYIAVWYATRARIEDDAQRYRAMYAPSTLAPTPTPAPVAATGPVKAASTKPAQTTPPTPMHKRSAAAGTAQTTAKASTAAAGTAQAAASAPARSAKPGPTRTASPTPAPTASPSPSVTPTPSPSVTPSPTATPEPTPAAMPTAVDIRLQSADPDTLVYALPTTAPVQDSFRELLSFNPDTVGYLEVPDLVALPVVQREYDNDYYLSHNLDGEESLEGALFLDGMNRLTPEDDCLIVYGHNMRNGTMFGRLDSYEGLKFMKAHPIVRFDTLYENRLYTPFAAFTASTLPGDRHYFDVRQFIFDEAGFDLFTLKMQARSARQSPIDVRYGDRLLLLVTCDYTDRQGRFILALRQLRPDERESEIKKLFEKVK